MPCKIDFVPWNTPLEKRLQTLAAGTCFHVMGFGCLFILFFMVYLIFYTKFWCPALIYVIWIYLDRHTGEGEGRRSEWVRNWKFWEYVRDHFPIKLHRLPDTHFDDNKNYLFCYFPHGVLPIGAIIGFGTEAAYFSKIFPNLKTHFCALGQFMNLPFTREVLISGGVRPSSVKSMSYILSKPGGNALILMVGGAAEAFYARPREYKFVLKNRKGFVKLALKHGSPLVPVISFGENDVWSQMDLSDWPWLRKCQEAIRKIIGIPPSILWGRGLFQYNFGILPYDRPINIVVGAPVLVEKNENPTQSDIDDLHKKFTEELTNLFEAQKHNYVTDSDDIHLEIV